MNFRKLTSSYCLIITPAIILVWFMLANSNVQEHRVSVPESNPKENLKAAKLEPPKENLKAAKIEPAVDTKKILKEEAVDLGALYLKLLEATSMTRLNRIAQEKKEEYAQAEPFPHIAIDDLFPIEVVRQASLEIEDSPSQVGGCREGNDNCFADRYQNKKNSIESEDKMGPVTRMLFSQMKSSNFLQFLEELSGIKNIIPDPHYRGSGIHQTLNGGMLAVHADFNRYKKFKLDRRVNAFVYLNDNWRDEYSGHLELWSRNKSKCVQNIAPTLGRFVVFSCTDFSYHGHPKPLSGPPNRSRRSLALYYYSNGRPSSECLPEGCDSQHSTLWQKTRCTECTNPICRAYNILPQ